MTFPQEAPGDGAKAVDWERERYERGAATFFNYRVRIARLCHRLAQFSTRPEAIFWTSREVSAAFREYEETVEAAVRAQVDEDVRRLEDERAELLALLLQWQTEQGWAWEHHPLAVGTREVLHDRDLILSTAQRSRVTANGQALLRQFPLRAALEPFKAVSPTADVEEVER